MKFGFTAGTPMGTGGQDRIYVESNRIRIIFPNRIGIEGIRISPDMAVEKLTQ